MIQFSRPALLPLLIVALLGLSGCKTAEEKAEDYYQSGLALLAKGDEGRAMIEFRNVFKYNGFHKDARKTYAGILMKEGKIQEAYSQYLRLIEQYPDTADVRQTLAEIAIDRGDWDEAERHGRAAIALAPEVPGVQAIKLALDYRTAVLARDEAARSKTADDAKALLVTLPDSRIARRIVIDRLVSGSDQMLAMPVVDDALKQEPGSLEYNMLKFRLLAQAEDTEGAGDQLKKMVDLFPDNAEVRSALIGWYMMRKDFDGAEAFLRKLAGDPAGPAEPHLALVQFLQAARGPEAARGELDRLIAANTDGADAGNANAHLYAALRATIDFEAGKTTEAVTAMEAIVKTAEPSDQTRRIQSMLARMLDATGNRVGARALVEDILAADPNNVEALKQRAGWFIEGDRSGDAIVDLRAALGQSPRDPAILTLMAAAYERDGSLDLAGEQLARAVEVSGVAPAESLRYAQFLLRQNRPQVAETVLINARQVSPDNPALLVGLAQFYVGQKEWPQAQDTVAALQKLDLPEAARAGVQSLQAAILAGQNRVDDSVALLQTQVDSGTTADGQSIAAVAMIVQTKLRDGKPEEARTYLDDLLARAPDDKGLRLLSAGVDAQLGRFDAAEATYRALIADDPTSDIPVRLLYAQLATQGKAEAASAVLAAGLAAIPKSPDLRWMQASTLEQEGRIDEAIAVYEGLYAENSSNTVVANNLASLITAHHDDDASLARAEAIARRLRELDVPAFQDTYGWIAFRRGNLDEALSHLEPAAKGLPGDLLTQFHLGMVYDKLGRATDATRQFERVLALAGGVDATAVQPQLATARQALDRLKATAPAP